MAKIDHYKKIIKKELAFHAKLNNADQPALSSELIIDKKENVFLLLTSGWHNNKYYHHVVFHIEIKQGKVVVKEDNTDYVIADKLEALGIPEEDLICPYLNPPIQENMKAAA